MSEKLKLANGQMFNLIPMGVITKEENKVRYFLFTSELTHDELKTIFFNNANLTSIDYIQEDGATKTYADCAKTLIVADVPGYKVDDNTTADIYIVTVCTDAVSMALRTAQEERTNIANALDFVLTSLMPTM